METRTKEEIHEIIMDYRNKIVDLVDSKSNMADFSDAIRHVLLEIVLSMDDKSKMSNFLNDFMSFLFLDLEANLKDLPEPEPEPEARIILLKIGILR